MRVSLFAPILSRSKELPSIARSFIRHYGKVMKKYASLLLLTALFLNGSYALGAEISEPKDQKETVPSDNLAVFDASAYNWPGAASSGAPLISAMTIKPGLAATPLMPFGECVYVDSKGMDPKGVQISFKTKREWGSFKAHHPEFMTLSPGCCSLVVSNPCGGQKKVLSAGRAGTFKTLAFSTHRVGVYQCVLSENATANWKRIGENSQAASCSVSAMPPAVKPHP
jgi:hypothetical protein